MNKDVEFRAWVKSKKQMVDVETIDLRYKNITFIEQDKEYNDVIRELTVSFKGVELMQYTGLKDKNGVKIFEGDILPIWENGENHLYKVVYDGDCFMLAMLDSEQGSYPLSVKHKQSEVIGNIYENPELLEVKDENN